MAYSGLPGDLAVSRTVLPAHLRGTGGCQRSLRACAALMGHGSTHRPALRPGSVPAAPPVATAQLSQSAWRLKLAKICPPCPHTNKKSRTVPSALHGSPYYAVGDFPTWILLSLCVAAGQLMETRTPVGRYASAPLLTMLAAIGMTSCGILPAASSAFEVVWSWFLPLAAVLFLLETKFQSIGPAEGSTVAAFFAGATGTVLGTVIAWATVGKHLGPEGWKLAGALCATYIGGSVNLAATAEALRLSSGVAPAMAADNIAMAAYIAVISSVPAKPKSWGDPTVEQRAVDGRFVPTTKFASERSAVLTVCTAMAVYGLGAIISGVLGLEAFAIAISSLLASALSAVLSKISGGPSPFQGAQTLGGTMLLFFFATIGASAGSFQSMVQNGWTLVFISIQLTVHLLVCLGVTRAFRVPTEVMLTASNANVGGPGTAAAMAVSRGWPKMVRPALLAGTLGYAIGTLVGVVLASALRSWSV